MNIRVVTLRYSEGLQGFPEDALRAATAGHEVLEVREHFFVLGSIPHLALVVLLADGPGSGQRPPSRLEDDPGLTLPEALRPLYRDLREWRNETAKKAGIPSYTILRNTQLAEICKRLPRTLAALREIDGIGEATCTKYGAALLALPRLREALAADTYCPRPYEQFSICDPKPRRISCAHFRDRVYVRYMDDLALWADDKERLFALAADLRALLAARLALELKEERTLIAPVGEGMAFLGWRVFPGLLRQQGPRLHRQRRLLARREAQYLAGEIGADRLQDCVRALAGPRKFLGYGEPLRSTIDV